MPLPERLRFSTPALVEIASTADRFPVVPGVNVYSIAQLWPPERAVFAAHMPGRAKSPAFAPPPTNDVMVSVPSPVFVRVTLFMTLVVPTFWLPKFMADELKDARGRPPPRLPSP